MKPVNFVLPRSQSLNKSLCPQCAGESAEPISSSSLSSRWLAIFYSQLPVFPPDWWSQLKNLACHTTRQRTYRHFSFIYIHQENRKYITSEYRLTVSLNLIRDSKWRLRSRSSVQCEATWPRKTHIAQTKNLAVNNIGPTLTYTTKEWTCQHTHIAALDSPNPRSKNNQTESSDTDSRWTKHLSKIRKKNQRKNPQNTLSFLLTPLLPTALDSTLLSARPPINHPPSSRGATCLAVTATLAKGAAHTQKK